MKKLITFLLSAIFAVTAFTACSDKDNSYKFYVPDGAPVLAVAEIWGEGVDIGGEKVDFELVRGGDALNSAIMGKKPDIALAPINVCAKSVKDTGGEYVFAGTAVNGLMYVVAQNSLDIDPEAFTFSDIIGKTLYAFQEAATPGITLKIALEKSIETESSEKPYNILTTENTAISETKVNIKFVDSPITVRTALTVGLEGIKADFGLLAEPAVTSLVSGDTSGLSRVLDIQDIWGESGYPQVGVIVRKSIADANPNFISALAVKLNSASEWAKNNSTAAAAKAKDYIESTELPAAAGIKLFLDGAGKKAYTFKPSAVCKETVKEFLSEIAAFNPKLIGDAVPDDSFFV